ncbi:hypothetical protein BKA66DRAFT_508942 [Pyrenochaeta sp. MPI-SDFR-AT-0127]|nr:hypothetical protein BKA66DRAFT_508942 [Pyrenochaeta sp. MPI-SDFR-AT-0127]
MGVAEDLKNDLPVAMTMAAFVGAAWYICVELNVRLWFSYLRKRGLYFWACFVGTQGVLTQPLLIVLADFGQIKNPYVAFTFIYLSWWMLVIPQSVVLYSRLHLIVSNPKHNRYVLYMIIFTTIFVSLPTVGLGVAAQASRIPHILSANLIWDRVQVTIFFLQETIISILYIVETRRVLLNRSILGQDDTTVRTVMRHLIYTNILVVFLDCSLLAMSYSPYFYVQAAFKPCVYGVKLRVEFSILNRLVSTLRGSLAHLKTVSSGHTPTLSGWNLRGKSTQETLPILAVGHCSLAFQPPPSPLTKVRSWSAKRLG